MTDIVQAIRGIELADQGEFGGPLEFSFSPGWCRVVHGTIVDWLPPAERQRAIRELVKLAIEILSRQEHQ